MAPSAEVAAGGEGTVWWAGSESGAGGAEGLRSREQPGGRPASAGLGGRGWPRPFVRSFIHPTCIYHNHCVSGDGSVVMTKIDLVPPHGETVVKQVNT